MKKVKSGDLVTLKSAEWFDFNSPNCEPLVFHGKQITKEMVDNLGGKTVEVDKAYPAFFWVKKWPYSIPYEFIEGWEDNLEKEDGSKSDEQKPVTEYTSPASEPKKNYNTSSKAEHQYGKDSVVVLISVEEFNAKMTMIPNKILQDYKNFPSALLGTKMKIDKKILSSYYRTKNGIKLWDCLIDHEATAKLGKTNLPQTKGKHSKSSDKSAASAIAKAKRESKRTGVSAPIVTRRQLEVGDLVIGWISKDETEDFVIGCYCGRDKDGESKLIQISRSKTVKVNYLVPYTPEEMAKRVQLKKDTCNPVINAFNKLYCELSERVGNFCTEYGVEIDFHMKIKDKS